MPRRPWTAAALAVLLPSIPHIAHADASVAVAAPLTGTYAELGAAIRAAVPSATVEDDQCQAEAAVSAAQKIVAMRPAAVIGHPCSSAAIAAAPIYAAANIPFIAVGARHGDLTDKRAGALVFRLAGRDDRQGVEAAEVLASLSGGRPIALLHDRTFAMSTIAGEAAKAISAAHPGLAVQQFPFVASELDYGALADKVVAFGAASGGVGAILFAGYPAEATVILQTLRARKVQAAFVGADAAAASGFSPSAGNLGDGVFVLSSSDRGADDLKARAEAAARLAPTMQAGTLEYNDPQLGRIAFDAKGDAQVPSYRVLRWVDGAWKPNAAGGMADKPPIP